MSTANQAYVSKSVPFGGVNVQIYRLADVDDNNSGALLGTYKIETVTPTQGSILNKRPDIDAGKNGWWLVNGDIEGSAVIQRNVVTTPSLQNGDYFEAAIRVDSAGAGITERFVIHNPSEEAGASYRKVSCSVIVDDQA